MKKLMIAAAAVAVAGGAFAANVGNIFDYKASVKYVDFKTVSAKDDNGDKANIIVKVVKSAKLTGYLVTPQCCPCQEVNNAANGPCERFGMAPSFLVLKNAASRNFNRDYGLSEVKLMPANLLTEWWTTKSLMNLKKNTALEAQGYLFAGVGKRDVPDPVASPFYGLGDRGLYETTDKHKYRTAATQFLFGYYNVVDAHVDFIEPFLDQAGFGKAQYCYDFGAIAGAPCEIGNDWDETKKCLISLSGHLIGGSFACAQNALPVKKDGKYWAVNTANGAVWAEAEAYLCQGWDDKTENAKSWGSVNADNQLEQIFQNPYMYNVVCGTWSIKLNTKINNGADIVDDVVNCATRIDRNFNIRTFDTPQTVRGAGIAGLEDRFYLKWMSDWDL